MTVVLYFLVFVAGAAVGILIYITFYAPEQSPPVYHRSGYASGHRDGAVGIWRDGPIR